jgi:glycosyltransferase involved in cell wall biosynthesis
MPKVSILMSVYNREKYLARSLESVLCQDFEDFEFIVWDDGSTDKSIDILRDYEAMDDRMRVIYHHHLGTPYPLLLAAREARGEYLGWVDSDDRIDRETLTETVAVLDAFPDVGLVYTHCKLIDECGRIVGKSRSSLLPYTDLGMLTEFLTFHFRLLRKSIYDSVGGIDESIRYSFDYDLCLRICEITRVYQLKRFLHYHRVHRNSITKEHRMEQIKCSQEAIERAIVRRGLQDKFFLDVNIMPQFILISKEKSNGQ